MALEVTIEYDQNVRAGERITLEAVVRNSETDAIVDTTTDPTLRYSWTLDDPTGRFIGVTNQAIVQYEAMNVDTSQNVGVTCEVSTFQGRPILTQVDLNTLSSIGVDGIDANMLITIEPVSGGGWFARDDANAFATGSDRDLPITGQDVRIGWITYSTSNRSFVIYRVQSGAGSTSLMSNYWGDPADQSENVNRKVPYLVMPNGMIVEFETSWFSGQGNGFIRYVIDDMDPEIIQMIEGVTRGAYVLMGIATKDTIDTVRNTASQTVIVSIQGSVSLTGARLTRTFIKPILDKINVGFINRLVQNTVFNKLEGVDNKPRVAYGVIRFSIPAYDENQPEQQRYRPVKLLVPIHTRIDGVSEFTDTNYIVMLQTVGNVITGERGRSFPVYGVYNKTSTSFSIAYEEGVTPEAFGATLSSVPVTLQWFARGK